MSSDVSTRLERIFAEVMVGEIVPVRERTKLSCLTWDSMMQLTLISAMEQEFQVTLTDDEAIELNSFTVALAILEEKLVAKPSAS